MTSPASVPNMAKSGMRSPSAPTSAFMKPRVCDIVRDRNTAAIGSFATPTANALALCLVLARADPRERKSWVDCGLHTHSPMAQTAAALVSSRGELP